MMATSVCPHKAPCGHSSWAAWVSVYSVYLTVPSVTQISYHYPQCHNANARQHSYEENGSSLRAPGPDADEIIRVDNEPGDCDEDCDSQA